MKETIKTCNSTGSRSNSKYSCGDDFVKAIELIYEQGSRKKGKLVASGMGKAGQIALNIATTFSSTGTPAVFLHPERFATRRPRCSPGKRCIVADFQLGKNPGNYLSWLNWPTIFIKIFR